jgi:flagellar biogenesis protein FliO
MFIKIFDAKEWAIILGIITLACWIIAGLMEVASTEGESEQTSQRITVVFTGLGLLAVVAMVFLLVAT